ncbi:MAG TPA: TM2 domain-containing protein [Pseudolabrys sp.]|jgi:TM2 domain-containing membrane protein YozV|uniref:TM2 domain-containing protein n=1 Tax=Pseudolabrys sp. TaxID=1960880 RepID=UPI002DDCEE31|nr:TM2 domain-containing protein [Pseudolabrys sp.]HEV2630064.1 TM2 domain-containing protein [Pseudolabrys sp.]
MSQQLNTRVQGVSSDARAMMMYEANKKSIVVAYLFWFFLGMFGAHRFYFGKTGSAIAQLILTITVIGSVVTFVWMIIDAFMIPDWLRSQNTMLAAQIAGP